MLLQLNLSIAGTILGREKLDRVSKQRTDEFTHTNKLPRGEWKGIELACFFIRRIMNSKANLMCCVDNRGEVDHKGGVRRTSGWILQSKKYMIQSRSSGWTGTTQRCAYTLNVYIYIYIYIYYLCELCFSVTHLLPPLNSPFFPWCTDGFPKIFFQNIQ